MKVIYKTQKRKKRRRKDSAVLIASIPPSMMLILNTKHRGEGFTVRNTKVLFKLGVPVPVQNLKSMEGERMLICFKCRRMNCALPIPTDGRCPSFERASWAKWVEGEERKELRKKLQKRKKIK